MKFTRDEYYKLANTDCTEVAFALGMTIDEGAQTTAKAIHINHSGGLYIFPHSNNWYRHIDGKSGYPVDLVMDSLCCNKEEALEFIMKNVSENYDIYAKKQSETGFVLPQECAPKRAIAYLTYTRGLDDIIVNNLINNGIISEDAKHHNCMFIGKDKSGNARSCALRGTSSVQFRGEVSGSDKTFSFSIPGTNNKLRCFESPIDAMSHATFTKLLGLDWQADHRLSCNGFCYGAISRYLKEHDEITTVILSFDNDNAGHKGAENIKQRLLEEFSEKEIFVCSVLPQNKDWNEDLIAFRQAESNGVKIIDFLRNAYPQIAMVLTKAE